jgi:hypothetical protein
LPNDLSITIIRFNAFIFNRSLNLHVRFPDASSDRSFAGIRNTDIFSLKERADMKKAGQGKIARL